MGNKTNPWTIVLTIVITAVVVVGGGFFLWQNQTSDTEGPAAVKETNEAVEVITETKEPVVPQASEATKTYTSEVGALQKGNKPSENDAYSFTEGINGESPLELNGDLLSIRVGYGGGCADHDWDLFWGGGFAESDPVQADLYLIHNSNDDNCEALLGDQLIFDLSTMKENYKSGYQESSGIISITVNSSNDSKTIQYSF